MSRVIVLVTALHRGRQAHACCTQSLLCIFVCPSQAMNVGVALPEWIFPKVRRQL